MELSQHILPEANMTRRAPANRENTRSGSTLGQLIHLAVRRGLTIGSAVKIGLVRGIVIGYNIAGRGRYPGLRYPLLIKTELGIAKFGLDEVLSA
jgi:hypothetical protein